MTPELLCAATGCTQDAADLYAAHLDEACRHYEIADRRQMMFLAQLAHESGGLRHVLELSTGDAYEGRNDLGNTRTGDGPRFKGRGLIQVTGRDNYRRMTTWLSRMDCPDFESTPSALTEPKWAVWSAAAWWYHNGCNALADAGNYVGIGRLINRGSAKAVKPAIGEPDRLARYETAKAAFGSTPAHPPPPRTDYEGAPSPAQESAMPLAPIAAAVLPSIIEFIPKLGKLFGSGSAVSERNIKAAEVVLETVTQATGAVNAQQAAEKLAKDPAAVQAATRAIDAIWYELSEAGGGGIDGARKADAAQRAAGDLLHSASFWVALMLLPLVYLLVLSLIGLVGTATWSDDVRAGLAGSLISAVIGGLVGYYYGQTTSRNRTQA